MTADTKKIGVFPAAGELGGRTTKHLARLVPPASLILIARKPEKLVEYSRQGAEVRRADYDDDSSLERVFEGVGALFLISYASCEHEHRSRVCIIFFDLSFFSVFWVTSILINIQAHRKAINAALKSGVRHIFYSSLAFARESDTKTAALVMRAHLDTEAYLKELASSGAPDFTYTILREGLYHESFPIYTSFFDPQAVIRNEPDVEQEIEIKIPHDGSGPGVAWAKRDELAEATAKIISTYARNPLGFPYINKSLLLSGPKVLTLQEVVKILEKVINEKRKKPVLIKIKPVSIEEYASQPQVPPMLTYHDLDISRDWATAWQAIKDGECAVVTPVLKEYLGREPEDFETTIREEYGGQ